MGLEPQMKSLTESQLRGLLEDAYREGWLNCHAVVMTKNYADAPQKRARLEQEKNERFDKIISEA